MNNIDEAFQFYTRHIYDKEKIYLLTKYKLKIAGSVPSVLWELFGALLTGRSGAGGKGADLNGWEVKSAKYGGSYEYQYHLKSGLTKLTDDCKVIHLFCTYSETYKDVWVRAIPGSILVGNYFEKWEPIYSANYDSSVTSDKRRQRFRKNIPYGYVEKNGITILRIEDGNLVFRDDNVILNFNGKI